MGKRDSHPRTPADWKLLRHSTRRSATPSPLLLLLTALGMRMSLLQPKAPRLRAQLLTLCAVISVPLPLPHLLLQSLWQLLRYVLNSR